MLCLGICQRCNSIMGNFEEELFRTTPAGCFIFVLVVASFFNSLERAVCLFEFCMDIDHPSSSVLHVCMLASRTQGNLT